MMRSSSGEIEGFNRIGAIGVRFRMASKITAGVFPVNAGRPVAIS